ncbi:multidrug transporter [Sphingomonas gilva]|uniref:Multidrug transporter n=1 Tax=Sphingomonas gilva TaxID=2305907 RepID=A0A396RQL9_9SPHN|nr:SapC family protein [Sphingomonas gilva]RHW18904.1 multidrug transporter [Sphingomonas gilva]
MASAPQSNSLPIFYNNLEPLSSQAHAKFKARMVDKAPFLTSNHAVPLTVDEFAMAQRHFPIVFSSGADSVPLALMGLNEGVNVFVDDEGKLIDPVYVPAYIRRYPFLLAKLRPDSDELSLCFDPTADAIGEFEEGQALFEDGQPSAATQEILKFAEQFEQAGQRTGQFMKELSESGLLIDGEVAIQPNDSDKPFVYRGFKMVSEEKLRETRGDQLRKWSQSGMLALIYAHMFSLGLMREIFARQMQLGKMPQPVMPAIN